jgi:hypothetical protein
MVNLNLFFTSYPLGILKRRALLLFCFEEPNGKPDVTWGFNSRTANYLRSLWDSKFWTGKESEDFLVSCRDLGNAEWILLLGLGKRASLNRERFVNRLRDSGRILGRLGIEDFGVYIPVIDDCEEGYACYLEESIMHILNALLQGYYNGPDRNIDIASSLDHEFISMMRSRVISLERKLEAIPAKHTIEFQGSETAFSSVRV